MLAWLVRFRFVTVGALAVRWEVSEQQMRARVRRLERERLVRRDRPRTNAPAAIFPTGRALTRLGLPVRQAVHFDGRFGHEVAIIKRVTAAEAYFRAHGQPDALVVTEREMRRSEAAGGQQFSVELRTPHDQPRRRWPDYVISTDAGRTAVELEFSPKATLRLESIVRGYLRAWYDFVDFVVLPGPRHSALRDRIAAIVDDQVRITSRAEELLGLPRTTHVRLVTWRDPYPALHAGIAPFPSMGGVAR